MLGIEVVCFDYNSEFFRMDHRAGALKKLADELIGACGDGPVFTHNPWGEYGHLDHILVHQIAVGNLSHVFCSSIAHPEAAWFPMPNCVMSGESEEECCLPPAPALVERCKAIYDRYGCWTWSFGVREIAGIYRC